MNCKLMLSTFIASMILVAPALAGQVWDTTTIGSDNSLSNGAGTTGPGMSGYNHTGLENKPIAMSSVTDGKTTERKLQKGFSRRPIYNNQAELALPRIR
jgi:hypothetical protein